jgi:hypothetical protein
MFGVEYGMSHDYILSTIMQSLPVPIEQGSLVKTYHTRLDDKKRVVIRNPQYSYYEVREFSDGHIELFPRILVAPDEFEGYISARTLQMLDSAAQHLANDIVSTPVNTAELLDLLDEDDRRELEAARRTMKER